MTELAEHLTIVKYFSKNFPEVLDETYEKKLSRVENIRTIIWLICVNNKKKMFIFFQAFMKH